MSGDALATASVLLATLLLIAGNALFVFHEFAFVRLRPPQIRRIEESGSRIDRLVAKMARHLDHYIAVDQLGITATSLAVGWIGQPALADLVGALIELPGLSVSSGIIATVAFIIAFSLITSLQVVLGELIPKTVALRSTSRVASLVALPVEASSWLLHPFVIVLNGAGNLLVRLLGFTPQGEGHAQVLPPDELEDVIRSSARAGLVPVDPGAIRQALHFSDLIASDLIVPRQEVVTVDISTSADELIGIVREHHFTRYPVIDGDLDSVAGILNAKDLVEIGEDGTTHIAIDWQRLIRPPLILPERASIEAVLQAMMQENQQLVLLADEHGGIAGMFTISDVSRMITGTTDDIVQINDGAYSVAGETAISVVETALDLSLGPGPEERDYETVGGLIMARLGRIPRVGDEVAVDDHALRVAQMHGFRITRATLQIDAADSAG